MTGRISPTRRGFTFIELVASMALIMLVLAFLFPTFARSRQAARRSNCMSNLHQFGVALHLYSQDYNGMFPAEDNRWSPLMSYVKNTQVFVCPNEPQDSREKYGWPGSYSEFAGLGQFMFSSYQYKGGLANDMPGNTPVARDWSPWDMNGVDVLYLDGNVKWSASDQAPQLTSAPRPRLASADHAN
jgi:competence protein ComGC